MRGHSDVWDVIFLCASYKCVNYVWYQPIKIRHTAKLGCWEIRFCFFFHSLTVSNRTHGLLPEKKKELHVLCLPTARPNDASLQNLQLLALSRSSATVIAVNWDRGGTCHGRLINYPRVLLFLGAFAKFAKKGQIGSSRLSVRMEELRSHLTDFHEIWYLRIFFENLSRKFKFH